MESDPYADLSDAAREACVRRMHRTLTKKPRSKKTRDYVKTLTGSPMLPPIERPTEKAVAAVSAAYVRRDRVSPMARKRAAFVEVRACREGPRVRQHSAPSPPREKRDNEAIYLERQILADAQNGLCGICAEPLHRATIDHVIPHSLGGANALGNFVVVHGDCNNAKANDLPTGCEMIFLLMVNAKIGALPVHF